MTLYDYAKKILSDSGCNEYTYGGVLSKHIMDDLKKAFPDGMEYPYIDVANEILSMSRPKPIKRVKYHLVCITDSFTEKVEFDDFENASDELWGTYYSWIEREKNSWRLFPTEEEKDEWDYMICNWWCYIEEYDPMTDEYKICYEPTEEKLEEFGWKCHTDFQKLTSM